MKNQLRCSPDDASLLRIVLTLQSALGTEDSLFVVAAHVVSADGAMHAKRVRRLPDARSSPRLAETILSGDMLVACVG
jgi:hypothetical protein